MKMQLVCHSEFCQQVNLRFTCRKQWQFVAVVNDRHNKSLKVPQEWAVDVQVPTQRLFWTNASGLSIQMFNDIIQVPRCVDENLYLTDGDVWQIHTTSQSMLYTQSYVGYIPHSWHVKDLLFLKHTYIITLLL